MSVTFPVNRSLDPVSKSWRKFSPSTVSENLVGRGRKRVYMDGAMDFVGGLIKPNKFPIEASGCNSDTLNAVHTHALLDTVETAYDLHKPLCLSPDDIWIAIAQGLALHVNLHAEELRTFFVGHSGKKVLRVDLDGFVRGAAIINDWPGAFQMFGEKIWAEVGPDKAALMSATFSTTGIIEGAVNNVVMMDTLSAYFEYLGGTLCGFPHITLLGTKEDWQQIIRRVQSFRTLGATDLSWWVDPLLQVLQHFVKAYDGAADPKFWESFYKENDESGGPYITGHINVFFPYVKDYHTNKLTQRNSMLAGKRGGHGPTHSMFPTGLSQVHFTWNYLGQLFPYDLLAGFVGFTEAAEGLRPSLGWAVRQSEDPLRFEASDDPLHPRPLDPDTHY